MTTTRPALDEVLPEPAGIDAVQAQPLSGVKVFSATMQHDRERLGETVTAWLKQHPALKVFDTWVTQSSDSAFHCVAITLFYSE